MADRPAFSSPRERRLWLLTLATLVAIFSTLGLARTLADELRRRDLIDATFAWLFLAIVLAIVALALRVRPRGIELGVWLGVLAVYGLVLTRMVLPEDRTHVIEYGVVAVLIHEALVERRGNGRPVPVPALVALVATVAIGALDEAVQLLIPSRVFDVEDILTNSISAAAALAAKLTLQAARAVADQRSRSARRV